MKAHALLVWMAAACSGGTVVQYEDTGTICVCAGDQGSCGPSVQRFEADRPVRIGFELTDVCLSSSCSLDREASCIVTRDGSTLHVATSASFRDKGADACTLDCGQLSATCTTGPLPSGSYTVTYGAKSLTFDVPSEVYSSCVRN